MPLPPLRILVAEDSLVNQKLAVGLLERRGHTVVIANNGKQAVATLASQDFDVVLMDVQMPEMDGLDATAAIRAREKQTGRHVPIIALTAHAMRGDRERFLAAGMDDFVAKPIRLQQLLETLQRVLAASDGSDPPPAGPSPQEPVMDWDGALATVAGDRALLRSLVETMLEEAPGLLEAIRGAVASGDAPALQRAAHTLKGSARYFKAAGVFERARDLEKMAGDGQLHDAEAVLENLEQAMGRFLPILEAYASTGEPPADGEVTPTRRVG